jgi:lipopolysaccharide assembly protein A
MQIYWIAALGFGIVIALFAVQNSAPVPIRFLWMGVEDVPISVLVLVCATLGALVTFLFGLGREIRMRMAGRSSRRTVRSQEQQIADLQATVQRLELEKADLQGRLEVLGGTIGGDQEPDRGTTERLPAGRPPLSLPPGEAERP